MLQQRRKVVSYQQGSEAIVNPLAGEEVMKQRPGVAEFEGFEEIAADSDAVHYAEQIEWRKVCGVLATPSCALIFLQGLPGCLPWGMVLVFLNDFFSNEGRLSVQAATALLATFSIGPSPHAVTMPLICQ